MGRDPDLDVTIVRPGQGRRLAWGGASVEYLATGDMTGDAYCLNVGPVPAGAGPPAHIQTREDEGFYVLDGELTFRAGNRSGVRLPAGGFLNVRPGTAHVFRNESSTSARLLLVHAPSGFDRFQFAVAEGGPALMRSMAPRYGIDYDPPPAAWERPPDARLVAPDRADAISVAVVGDLYTFLATGDDTVGAYALIDALVPPGGGPPPHRHTREVEAFYVLDGELSFLAIDRWLRAGPGTFVHIPKGVRHAFKNDGAAPARMLILLAPAGFERLFLEVGRPNADRAVAPPPPSPADKQLLLAALPGYGVELAL